MDVPDLSIPETPPPDEPVKMPVLGIASLAGALLAVFSICGFIGFIYTYDALTSSVQDKIGILGWFFVCLFPIGCLVAVALGIAALVQKEMNKTFAILGLVFGGFLMACMFCLVISGMFLVLFIALTGSGI